MTTTPRTPTEPICADERQRLLDSAICPINELNNKSEFGNRIYGVHAFTQRD